MIYFAHYSHIITAFISKFCHNVPIVLHIINFIKLYYQNQENLTIK